MPGGTASNNKIVNNVKLKKLQIGGQIFTANHTSKAQAKQMACEKCLRTMLAKKISEPFGKLKILNQLTFNVAVKYMPTHNIYINKY